MENLSDDNQSRGDAKEDRLLPVDVMPTSKIARFAIRQGSEVRIGLVENDLVWELSYRDPLAALNATDPTRVGRHFSIDDVEWLPPVIPSKIICVGRNYAAHAAEFGNEVPEEPLLFFKPSSALIGHKHAIVYPSISKRMDFEGELAIILRKTVRNWSATQVKNESHLLAFTNFNDVTARDIQRGDRQWTRGKGFDTFAPMGPWMVGYNKIPDFRLETHLNDEVVQNGESSLLIHDVPKLIEYISRVMTLNPGDVIATGTPAGVDELQEGDKISISVDIVGAALVNTVILEDWEAT